MHDQKLGAPLYTSCENFSLLIFSVNSRVTRKKEREKKREIIIASVKASLSQGAFCFKLMFIFQPLKSGSTAICSLIRGKTLYTAWLGDSQVAINIIIADI